VVRRPNPSTPQAPDHWSKILAATGQPIAATGQNNLQPPVSSKLQLTQIAMTEASCTEVYASAGYESSAQNFPNTPLAGDNVFGDDGGIHQLASTSGSVAAGYTAALNVII
jgi:hypothetical protein